MRCLYPSFIVCVVCSLGWQTIPTNANTFTLHPTSETFVPVAAPALYPEGVELHPETGEFLLGSIRKGKVVAVAPDGSVRTLVDDDRLRSVVGIRVDRRRNVLLVNNSDYGVAERSRPEDRFATAALGVYDLTTGEPVQYVDLSGLRPGESRFVNDLAVDTAGNVYVTDSRAAAIYRITPAGRAQVFLTHERFRGEGFNLNGIQYHADGFLIVAKKSDGTLFRVPIAEPEAFTEITLPRPLIGTDGLVLLDNDDLLVITNIAAGSQSNTVFHLTSGDGWRSAELAGSLETGDVYATTGTVRDGRVYVNHGRLNTLSASVKDAVANPFLETFRIQEVGIVE